MSERDIAARQEALIARVHDLMARADAVRQLAAEIDADIAIERAMCSLRPNEREMRPQWDA
jgi:hypothetical protein